MLVLAHNQQLPPPSGTPSFKRESCLHYIICLSFRFVFLINSSSCLIEEWDRLRWRSFIVVFSVHTETPSPFGYSLFLRRRAIYSCVRQKCRYSRRASEMSVLQAFAAGITAAITAVAAIIKYVAAVITAKRGRGANILL